MNKLAAEEIINLLFLPMSDEKLLDIFEKLNIEVPVLDEEYEMEGSVWTEGEETSGIAIEFTKPNDYSEDADPIVKQIDFYNEFKVSFPFGLHKEDSLETVIKKIGRNPDFCNKRMSWSKQWVSPLRDMEIVYAVHFKRDMKSINTIVITKFNRKSVEADEFIFPCEELEE